MTRRHPTIRSLLALALWASLVEFPARAAELPPPFPTDPLQLLERTCFQTGQAWSPAGNLRSDVAIVYGIDAGLPERIRTWRDRGYRIHVMTGVSWGHYQDYLYGRFDGTNHEDEAQTDRHGKKISHGGDVYYMCPGANFGKFLTVGVQRALDAGAEAVHLEEPEFWVRGGYSEGFKREWRDYYQEPWQPPHASADAQWRASKLKYYLYRRALQQVFDHVQEFNRRTGKSVRCYVPTHSLLNYAHWRIVSPESSLARLDGCDGYIAQVWTGTSRTPNRYRGVVRERTFETAFLEYGAMQNLVRATGRTVWYLNDPIEDDPKHDWEDYRTNWESTLVASLLQPDVWQFEVAPWPERIFAGRYPAGSPSPSPIPPAYATELQTVMNALHDLKQSEIAWDCGTQGLGVLVSDSLMFQRGDPHSGDPHLGNVYGLALPFLKRGLPVAPVQLENVTLPGYLARERILLLTYQGQKPLSADVHAALAKWVREGGLLVICDDGQDPYNSVREWWNADAPDAQPLGHLFAQLGLRVGTALGAASGPELSAGKPVPVGRGRVLWLKESPVSFAASAEGDLRLRDAVRDLATASGVAWRETHYLLLRRGPYTLAAGLEESVDDTPRAVPGRWVNLFDPELRTRTNVVITPGSRFFLRDLSGDPGTDPQVMASACKSLVTHRTADSVTVTVEGVAGTPAIVLLQAPRAPREVTLEGQPQAATVEFEAWSRLLRVRFTNESRPRSLNLSF